MFPKESHTYIFLHVHDSKLWHIYQYLLESFKNLKDSNTYTRSLDSPKMAAAWFGDLTNNQILPRINSLVPHRVIIKALVDVLTKAIL
jgi:hypothetical protein